MRRTAKQMAEIRLAEYKRQQFYHKVRWTIFWILASPVILDGNSGYIHTDFLLGSVFTAC
jgi:hypothetical protein